MIIDPNQTINSPKQLAENHPNDEEREIKNNLQGQTNNKVSFAIGTGRCGTKFLYRVFDLEPQVASVHERNPLNETFHRYCKWYNLPVDHEGFLQTKECEIEQDLEKHSFSFEASAFLSLSLQELYERFGAKFILLVRSPEAVVNSYLRKGWYEKPSVRADPNLIPSYQDCRAFHHFLGRIMPSEEKFQQWNQMSRVGKLAWYWNALNAKVLEQFDSIPQNNWRVEKLETLSYSSYREISQFLGFKSQVTQETYDRLVKSRPNAKKNVPTVETWAKTEIDEFEAEVAPIAQKLGYEYRINRLSLPDEFSDLGKKSVSSQRNKEKVGNFLLNKLKSRLKNSKPL